MRVPLVPLVPLAALVVLAAVLAGTACPKRPAEDRDDTAAASITPVYDASVAPAPAALALCTALHGLPSSRKAACCAEPNGASPVVGPCAGALTSALLLKDVVVAEAKAGACAAARTAQLEGCDWVGALAPPPPPACRDVVTGTVGEGARCRSSLTCAAGLRCHGASLLDTGRCGKPSAAGQRCGASVDALAVVVGQPEVDRAHPECAGACVLGRCTPLANEGDRCHADAECGEGNRCAGAPVKVCTAGRIALAAACTGGGCVEGARCVDGACRAKSDTGGACASELDCLRGGCVAGACAMACPK